MSSPEETKYTFIYGLVDPRNPTEIRYVGKADDPQTRLRQHCDTRGLRVVTQKNNWIKSLYVEKVSPSLVVLQRVPEEQWQTYERAWIRRYRALGARLLNGTDGGEGVGKGNVISATTRKKISDAKKGMNFSEGHREKLSKAKRGTKYSEKHRKGIAAGLQRYFAGRLEGMKRSEEHRKKISEGLRRYYAGRAKNVLG